MQETLQAFLAWSHAGGGIRHLTTADLALILVLAVIAGIAAGAFAWLLTRGARQTIGWTGSVFLAVFLAALELWDRL